MLIEVYYLDKRYPLELDTLSLDLETLHLLIFSLVEVTLPDARLVLIAENYGEIREDGDVALFLQSPTSLTILSRNYFLSSSISLQSQRTAKLASTAFPAEVFQKQNTMSLVNRLESLRQTMHQYLDESTIFNARRKVPYGLLHSRIAEKHQDSSKSYAEKFLTELCFWFKHEYFQWVNNAPCSHCASKSTVGIGSSAPSIAEISDMANMVELYRCSECNLVTRFPRYNHPKKLLETKQGRCGEWANCFTLICVASGFHCRYVMDFTDHVWTEVWLPEKNDGSGLLSYIPSSETSTLGNFVHVDPCENLIDSPLVYEQGWKKKLSYIFSVGFDEVLDVSCRYTKDFETWNEMLSRRTLLQESMLKEIVSSFNQFQHNLVCRYHKNDSLQHYKQRFGVFRESEVAFLLKKTISPSNDQGSAQGTVSAVLQETEMQGRTTGSIEWRLARGELGDIASSPSPVPAPLPVAAPPAASPAHPPTTTSTTNVQFE
jgi:peptide-N4-(N-acetyl-beta-glucosaminyl)asparagine amidase